jgi:predicted DNA binding protein
MELKKAALAREFGISRETLYQYLRDRATIPEGSDV